MVQQNEALMEDSTAGEAEAVLRSCLLVREGKPPVETLEVGTVLVDLAAVVLEVGRVGEAEELCRRALAIRGRFLGSQHPDMAAALLGAPWRTVRVVGFSVVVRVRLAMDIRPPLATGVNHTLAACSEMHSEPTRRGAQSCSGRVAGLGAVVLQSGRSEEAKSLAHKAVQVCTLRLGKEHPLTCSAKDLLAKCSAQLQTGQLKASGSGTVLGTLGGSGRLD